VDRRTFLSTLGISVIAAALVVEAQPATKVWRIGRYLGLIHEH
jgi:hypothetical protein